MQEVWQVFGGALGSGCFSEVGFIIAGIEVVAVRKPDAVDVAPQFRPEKTVFDDSDPFVGQVFVEHDLNPVPIFITRIDWFGNGADFFSPGSVSVADPGGADDDADPVRSPMGQDVISRRKGSDDRFGGFGGPVENFQLVGPVFSPCSRPCLLYTSDAADEP